MEGENVPMPLQVNTEAISSTSPVLVYDGSCGFCSRSVRFILRHEQRHDLVFVTRDSELGRQLRRTYGFESIQSMLWIENGRAFAESGAVMSAARYMGGGWSRLAALGSLVPPTILNSIYRIIARYRRRLSTNLNACPLPSPEERRRFLA
jgi:predicted DCC family thiol-disulfide oxidoreductase YuxK